MLTRPSVLEERRRVGCAGWSWREVIVSVWDSIRERVGVEGLRWSLGRDQHVSGARLEKDVPDVDGRYAGSVIGVFDASCDEVFLGVADKC
jgi:hypothetical protein